MHPNKPSSSRNELETTSHDLMLPRVEAARAAEMFERARSSMNGPQRRISRSST